MRALVIGLGSMGKRRIRCLNALGITNITGIDPRPDRRQEATVLYGIQTTVGADFGRPSFVIISAPPDTHDRYAQTANHINVPCFVEAGTKPLSYGTPSATMLFHPAIKAIKDLIPEVGQISNIIYHSGQYLPDWHPYEKVSDFYASTSGATEMVAFELTWLTHLFGFPLRTQAYRGKTVHIDGLRAPDTYNIIMDYGYMFASLVVDVISRHATRRLVVNGSKAQLLWDWDLHHVTLRDNHDQRTIPYAEPHCSGGYHHNIDEQMYIDELASFIKGNFPHTLDHNNRIIQLTASYENCPTH